MAGAPHPAVALALRHAHADLKAELERHGFAVFRFELSPAGDLGEGWCKVRRLDVFGRKDGRELRLEREVDGAALVRRRVRRARASTSKRFDAPENQVIPEDVSP